MPKHFFGFVWRFNALAIAGVSLMALFVGTYAVFEIGRDVFWRPYRAHDVARVSPADGTGGGSGVRTDLAVSRFSAIRGTTTLWSPVEATQTYDYRTSSKQASSTRNYVFYDTVAGTSHKLLEDDERLITEARELRADDPDARLPPKALFFALIEADTNKDGVLNNDDTVTLALARTDGRDLTRLEGSQGYFAGDSISANGNELILVVRDGKAVKALHIDLETFKVKRSVDVVH